MRKRDVVLLGGLVFWLGLSGSGLALPEKRFDPITQTCRVLNFENEYAGYKTFRRHCKSCHNRNNTEASFLYNESKSSPAWTRVFKERYPACAEQGEWDSLSLNDLLKLNDYLFRNGGGTYDPTYCG